MENKSHRNTLRCLLAGTALGACLMASAGPQDDLEILVNAPGAALEFNWPTIKVGTASYEAGPTGATVIHFDRKVFSAIDVRGTPGTINAPYMDLQYDLAELDTVVFAGGSWYGLEAVTGVASALKDDGIRDGSAFGEVPNIAMSVGSIIFDFGARRLNEIYPDKRLGQAAYRAAEPGRFPLGATGARLVTTVAMELRRSQKRYGLATQCIGAGMGISTIIERLD